MAKHMRTLDDEKRLEVPKKFVQWVAWTLQKVSYMPTEVCLVIGIVKPSFVISRILVAEAKLSNPPGLAASSSNSLQPRGPPSAHFQSFLMSKDHLNCRWVWLSSSTNLETAS